MGTSDRNPEVFADAASIARLIAREARWRGKRARVAQSAFCKEVENHVIQQQLRAWDEERRWIENEPDDRRRDAPDEDIPF